MALLKAPTLSDLIHRVTSSCLTTDQHQHQKQEGSESDHDGPEQDQSLSETLTLASIYDDDDDEKEAAMVEMLKETVALTSEVFDAVSAMKRAYVSLQEAHSPWDPERMRIADVAVVAELRRIGRLRDRFRRGGGGGGGAAPAQAREVAAPYEAAMEDMRREMRAKEAEIEGLRERLRTAAAAAARGSAKKGRVPYGKRVGCIRGLGTPLASPTSELFKACMEEVKSTSKSFTAHLLSLMRAAHWDIAAAARSIIESATSDNSTNTDHLTIPSVEPHHAKHALESYITRKIFHGFENETFYIDGSLTSLLHPLEFRRDCFSQFRDMRSMDPGEILGILPTCQFGKFAGKKYLGIVHPKMEESLFGGAEQRRQVLAGTHPRTGFYGEYLRLAKAVWLLHLLAFALDPSPSHFEASKGAEFHPEYMESVVRMPAGGRGGGGGGGWVVGFSVGPGFKLGNGSVVQARVYLVPRVSEIM